MRSEGWGRLVLRGGGVLLMLIGMGRAAKMFRGDQADPYFLLLAGIILVLLSLIGGRT